MAKSRKNSRKNTGTRRSKKGGKGPLDSFEKEITLVFFQILLMIKLYHWKTYSYATHKATDDLNAKLHKNVDSFVEVLLGKRGDRVNLTHKKHLSIKDYKSVGEFKRELEKFKSYLVGLDNCVALKTMSNSDLYNIRDEMLANINQFLYLLTFK